jgi:Anti-sigma factor NepR
MNHRKPGSELPIEKAASPSQKGPRAELGRNIQATIGLQLRAMYDDVVKQGVPDRFTELLNQLDSGDQKGSHNADG